MVCVLIPDGIKINGAVDNIPKYDNYNITRSEARFDCLLLDCELSYCFHWVVVVVGGQGA